MNTLKYQTAETIARLRRFAEIYFANKSEEYETDMYWWFMAIHEAKLTQHDRAVLAEYDHAKRLRELLKIK